MLSSRQFQRFFLFLALAIAIFFIFRFGVSLKNYLGLRSQVPAKVTQWELEQIGDRWAIRAVYSMDIQGKICFGATSLEEHRYLNEEAAFRGLQELAKQDWKAWYSPKDSSKSSLEKVFPYNLLFRMLASCGVLIYFFLFQRWLVRKYLIA